MSAEDIRKILNTFNDIDSNKKKLQEHRSLSKRRIDPLSEIKMPNFKIPNFFKKKPAVPETKFDSELFSFAQNLSLPSDYDVNERHDYYREDDGTLVATVDCFVNKPKYTKNTNGLDLHGDALEKYMRTTFPEFAGTVRIKEDSVDVTEDYNVNDEDEDEDSVIPYIAVYRHTFKCPSQSEDYNV